MLNETKESHIGNSKNQKSKVFRCERCGLLMTDSKNHKCDIANTIVQWWI